MRKEAAEPVMKMFKQPSKIGLIFALLGIIFLGYGFFQAYSLKPEIAEVNSEGASEGEISGLCDVNGDGLINWKDCDVNKDGRLDLRDIGRMDILMEEGEYLESADLNADGVVNQIDMDTIKIWYSKGLSISKFFAKPSALMGLSLGIGIVFLCSGALLLFMERKTVLGK